MNDLQRTGSASMGDLFRLATDLLPSGFLPEHLKNAGSVVATIMAGQELGLAPMASLRSIHLVKGKVVIDAGAQLALLHSAGVRTRWVETSDTIAHLELSRHGEEAQQWTYTIQQAKNAGLAGKDVWRKHTAAMLRARCVSSAARAFAPEVLMGVYTPDEATEIDPVGYEPPVYVDTVPLLDDKGHHPSWEKDRPGFHARLGDVGWDYYELCEYLEHMGGKTRPSAMSNAHRRTLVGKLLDDPELGADWRQVRRNRIKEEKREAEEAGLQVSPVREDA